VGALLLCFPPHSSSFWWQDEGVGIEGHADPERRPILELDSLIVELESHTHLRTLFQTLRHASSMESSSTGQGQPKMQGEEEDQTTEEETDECLAVSENEDAEEEERMGLGADTVSTSRLEEPTDEEGEGLQEAVEPGAWATPLNAPCKGGEEDTGVHCLALAPKSEVVDRARRLDGSCGLQPMRDRVIPPFQSTLLEVITCGCW
jgi:hypothetical protein